MMLFDQVAFQDKSLQLRVCNNILKPPDMRHHLFDLDALVPAALEILPYPVLQADRLADINDMIILVMHNIDPGTSRQLL